MLWFVFPNNVFGFLSHNSTIAIHTFFFIWIPIDFSSNNNCSCKCKQSAPQNSAPYQTQRTTRVAFDIFFCHDDTSNIIVASISKKITQNVRISLKLFPIFLSMQYIHSFIYELECTSSNISADKCLSARCMEYSGEAQPVLWNWANQVSKPQSARGVLFAAYNLSWK